MKTIWLIITTNQANHAAPQQITNENQQSYLIYPYKIYVIVDDKALEP
jgi:hypothetical protein